MNNYERVSYPVFVAKKFDFITYSEADEFKVGQVFNYEIDNQIHLAWHESKCFTPIPNEDCEYKILRDDMSPFAQGQIVQYSDLNATRIDEWVLAGFIKKIYPKSGLKIKKENNQPKKVIKNKKSVKKNAYNKLAKNLNLTPSKFRKKYFEIFGKELKDLKKEISKKKENEILEALSK